MLSFLLVAAIGLTACNKEDNSKEQKEVPEITQNIDGIRIAWDFSSRVKIAPSLNQPDGYYGYSRMKQLYDGRLACVYETTPGRRNVELVFSNDLGETWSNPQTIFQTENNIDMAVPDLIELSDHSILIACNPRPNEPYTNERKFAIKIRKSTDGGANWDDERLIYEAQSTFNNGCWEPSFAQLPSGEVQLFFSNEGVYSSSDEQNISMFRSLDNGDSWSAEPVIAGFRQGHRDGMPVPLVLEDKGEILIAVEDNKVGEFKPTIYHEKIADNWTDGFVSATDSRRSYHPFSNPLSESIYAGAPYLARLGSGEVLLSYQTTLNRSRQWDLCAMAVEIGNNSGTEFQNRSVPFQIPLTKVGFWNSISVIEDGTIPVAITTTNGYAYNSFEVWMIKGHVIPEYTIQQGTATVDGRLDDACWDSEWPYFVGHQRNTNLGASVCRNQSELFLACQVENADFAAGSESEIVFQLDTERKGYTLPHEEVYSIHCQTNGEVRVEAGSFGNWKQLEVPGSLKYKVVHTGATYSMELSIPLDYFQIAPTAGHGMGVNFRLKYRIPGGTLVDEPMGGNEPDKPYTWSPLIFNPL